MMLLEEKSDNERSVKGRYKDTKQTPHCKSFNLRGQVLVRIKKKVFMLLLMLSQPSKENISLSIFRILPYKCIGRGGNGPVCGSK